MKRRTALLVLLVLATLAVVLSLPSPIPLTLMSPTHWSYLPSVSRNWEAPDPRQGLGASWGKIGDLELIGHQFGWAYNWGFGVPGMSFYDDRFVDMVWDGNQVGKTVVSRYLLGFNEPNLCEQANMSPLLGAVMWHQVESIYADKVLISPSPSQPVSSSTCQTWQGGFQWLWRMVLEYQDAFAANPRFDAIAVHCYNINCISYIQAVHNDAIAHGYDVPIWVTEFGWCSSNPDYLNNMLATLNWMSDQSWIERWAWFGLRIPEGMLCDGLAMIEGSSLTPSGQTYFSWRDR